MLFLRPRSLIESMLQPATVIGRAMSLELLSQLETKIQATLESVELLKMELEEEKQKNEALESKNQQLQEDLNSWNDKVNGLVGLLNSEV